MSWLFATALPPQEFLQAAYNLSMVVHAEGILWIHMLAESTIGMVVCHLLRGF
jgi:hypothetical protein